MQKVFLLLFLLAVLKTGFAQGNQSINSNIERNQATIQGDLDSLNLFTKTSSSDITYLSISDGIIYGISVQRGDKIESEKESSYPGQKLNSKDQLYFYGDIIGLYLLEVNVKSGYGNLLSKMGNSKSRVPISSLDIQVNTSQKNGSWMPASSLPKTGKDSKMIAIYESGEDPLITQEETIIKIRSTKTKEIYREIVLRRKELMPQLKRIYHDSTGNYFFEKEIGGSNQIIEDIYSEKNINDQAETPVMPILSPTSRMLWFFKKPTPDFTDSSLNYQLIANGKPVFDSARTTGHMLLLQNLKSNTQYQLEIAYTLIPDRKTTYNFSMPPMWYQRVLFQWLLFFGLGIIAFTTLYLYFRKKARKAERKMQETKQGLASIRAQLNPHFVFNALSSIQALINKNDVETANRYLGQFSKLLRTSLEPAYQGMIPLQKELELIDQYVSIEQLRLPFNYEKEIAPGLDIHAIEIPGMLLQPLVENAIRHGLNKAAAPSLRVVIIAENKDLMIQIIDNGQTLKLPISQGYGLQMVHEKLGLLCEQFGSGLASFNLYSGSQNTIAEIKLSKWIDS